MRKWFGLRRLFGQFLGRPSVSRDQLAEEEDRVTSVDAALIIEAARHVVTTRIATRASITRHLYVSAQVADQLLAKLESWGVIAPDEPGKTRRVLTTSARLPAIVAEFQRRHDERLS
jgi:ribosomal protein S25